MLTTVQLRFIMKWLSCDGRTYTASIMLGGRVRGYPSLRGRGRERGGPRGDRGRSSERMSYSPVKNGHCSIIAEFFSSINQRIRLSFKKIFIVTCREMIITIQGAPSGQYSTESVYIYI